MRDDADGLTRSRGGDGLSFSTDDNGGRERFNDHPHVHFASFACTKVEFLIDALERWMCDRQTIASGRGVESGIFSGATAAPTA